jgi:Spy/CpxP family protein refolding chaperone
MLSLVVFTLSGLAACSPDEASSTSSPLEQEVSPDHGFMAPKMLQRMMDRLDLRADQRAALESLARDLKVKLEPARKLRRQAALELVAQIRAGQINRVRLDEWGRKLQAQRQAVAPEMVAALNQLHRTLTPAQRAKLIDVMEDRFMGHAGPWGHLRKMHQLKKQLSLSDDQIDRIKASAELVFGSRSDRMARMATLHDQLEDATKAFKSESFDAAKLPILAQLQSLHRPEQLVRLIELSLPVLTAEQRNKVATLIEDHLRQHAAPRPE